MSEARRLASPVRVTLNPSLGGDIDGAWWPHRGSLAHELPKLIEALYPALGEVVDIKLNWTEAAGAPVLKPLSSGSMSMLGWNDRRQRLMFVAAPKEIPAKRAEAAAWFDALAAELEARPRLVPPG